MNPNSPVPQDAASAREAPVSETTLQDLRESLHDIRNHLNAILGLVSMTLLQ